MLERQRSQNYIFKIWKQFQKESPPDHEQLMQFMFAAQ